MIISVSRALQYILQSDTSINDLTGTGITDKQNAIRLGSGLNPNVFNSGEFFNTKDYHFNSLQTLMGAQAIPGNWILDYIRYSTFNPSIEDRDNPYIEISGSFGSISMLGCNDNEESIISEFTGNISLDIYSNNNNDTDIENIAKRILYIIIGTTRSYSGRVTAPNPLTYYSSIPSQAVNIINAPSVDEVLARAGLTYLGLRLESILSDANMSNISLNFQCTGQEILG